MGSAVLVIGMLLFNTWSELRDIFTHTRRFDVGTPPTPSTLARDENPKPKLEP